MKSWIITIVCVLLASPAVAGHAGVNLNVNVGGPPVVVAPVPPQVVITTAPEFIFSPRLGFYVSVAVPYDIVFINGSYYLYNGGYWYAGRTVRGPWVATYRDRLPPLLRRYRYEQIRMFRDREYRHYQHDRDHYRGRWHRPEGEWRDHRGERRGEHR